LYQEDQYEWQYQNEADQLPSSGRVVGASLKRSGINRQKNNAELYNHPKVYSFYSSKMQDDKNSKEKKIISSI
jgi:hypothetical protein